MNKYLIEDNYFIEKRQVQDLINAENFNFYDSEALEHLQRCSKIGNKFRSFYRNPVLFKSSEHKYSYSPSISPLEIATNKMVPDISCNQNELLLDVPQKTKDPNFTKDVSSVFIKTGSKLVKVTLESVLFIHTDSKNYCSLTTADHKKLSVRYSILGLYKLLNKDTFLQTHRSYIINWNKVDAIHESDQTLEINGHHIPIGRTYKKNVYAKLNIL